MIRLSSLCLVSALLLAMTSGTSAASTDLQPVGTGSVRYLGMIKVYDATLYAPAQATEDDILTAQESFCLQLDYAVSIPADTFVEAAETILARQHQPHNLEGVRDAIDLLHRSYRDVQAGDRYRLCYDNRQQMSRLLLNDEILAIIESPEFAAVYFGIWLSPNQPLDRTLQSKLVAGLEEGRP